MLRSIACAVLTAALAAPLPVRAQSHDIGQVFRDFEAICFTFAEEGYGVDVSYLIEDAKFKFVRKAGDGTDIFNNDDVQLVIGGKACAFGMAQLPYAQMLQWTRQWTMSRGLADGATSKTQRGGQYTLFRGEAFNIGLEANQFPDGTPLTGLILLKK